MTRHLILLANLILRRWDTPVRQHPPGHGGCIRCADWARGYLAATIDATHYGPIRNAEADMVKLVQLKDEYRGAES